MVYKGQFNIRKEIFEGFGIYYYFNNEIYEGHWKNNNKNGLGILKLKSGIKLYGEWKDDKIIKIIKEQYLNIS